MDTRPDRKSNRKRQLEDVASAQANAGVTSDKAPGLDAVSKAIRAKVPRAAKAVWDASYAAKPGMQTLQLAQAILAVQAFEIARLSKLAEAEKNATTKAGILDMIAETRRNGRHLKGITDGLTKLAKVAADIDLGVLPDHITFVGSGVLRSQLRGDEADADTVH